MYFPILRGRQFELLALRECVQKKILSERIIPIIEPVKVSSTFTKTVDSFLMNGRSIAIIRNPKVGSWGGEYNKDTNAAIKAQIDEQIKNPVVISSFYVGPDLSNCISFANEKDISIESLLLICKNNDHIKFYEEVIGNNQPLYNLIPDRGDFRRRIRPNRIMCEDHFIKRPRNIDYYEIDDEFFSSDHIYCYEDGYKGFSDYSVVGEEYSETGFAPYAIAIHIVYWDDDRSLRIAHFVSDTNDDISDPARKFAEAVEKMVVWNKDFGLDTVGITELEKAYKSKSFPGLGTIKKYSIMHHLELMSRFLDGEEL